MCDPLLNHKSELTILKHILPIFVVLITVSGVHAYAQVEVKQSVTTNYNGQNTGIKTESKAPASICLGLPNECDLSSELKLPQGETIQVTEQSGAVMIEYCKDKQSHTYVLDDNESIQKVSKE
jgi:hypothetical protein